MTLEDYFKEVDRSYQVNPTWRYGQTLFNCLVEVRPDLSEQIRTTKLDPFFKDDDAGLDDFLDWLDVNWDE
jgi:hypothetical protein